MKQFDATTLCPDYRFIRVVSKEGVFFDLVRKWAAREHVFRLSQTYPEAKTVSRAQVPPCIFRDFTELNGQENFCHAIWRDGTQHLLPLTDADRALL